jgi:hypothetical protein
MSSQNPQNEFNFHLKLIALLSEIIELNRGLKGFNCFIILPFYSQ